MNSGHPGSCDNSFPKEDETPCPTRGMGLNNYDLLLVVENHEGRKNTWTIRISIL
jgi:hypothetical protein